MFVSQGRLSFWLSLNPFSEWISLRHRPNTQYPVDLCAVDRRRSSTLNPGRAKAPPKPPWFSTRVRTFHPSLTGTALASPCPNRNHELIKDLYGLARFKTSVDHGNCMLTLQAGASAIERGLNILLPLEGTSIKALEHAGTVP